MLRFILAMALVGGGGVLLWQTLAQTAAAPQQAGAAAALAGIGLLANFVTIFRRRLSLRPWVRNLSALIGLILLAGLLIMRYRIDTVVLPDVPIHDRMLRRTLEHWEDALVWLAIAAGYATFSLALLPVRRRADKDNLKSVTAPDESAAGG